MLKRKRNNKFYIGKEEVTLFAVFLPDLLLDEPQDYYFHFNPKNKMFEMQKDKTYAYWASQVFYDSSFIILAQHKNSERIDLVNDKTFLFEFFSETMDKDDVELFLEHGQEEINKIHASYENMKKLLVEVGEGLFVPEDFISQYLKKEYGEDLIFTITPNGYGYLLEIHKYHKTLLPLFRFNFNKNWRKKRISNELYNLKHNPKFREAIIHSLGSVKEYETEVIEEKAKAILSNCNIGKINNITNRIQNNKTIFMIRLVLFSGGFLTIHFTKELNLIQITKSITDNSKEEIIDGITYVKPVAFIETFANINSKIHLEDTDKWVPILDKL